MEHVLSNAWAVIVGGGFVIGFLIGITGVGAGSLTTPLLIGVGYPPHIAVGTDLLFASLTKASAAWRHQRLGNVNWGILGWLALGSLPGAAAMLGWLYFAKPDTQFLAATIRQVLAGALVVSAIAILVSAWLRRLQPPEAHAAIDVPPRGFPTFCFRPCAGRARGADLGRRRRHRRRGADGALSDAVGAAHRRHGHRARDSLDVRFRPWSRRHGQSRSDAARRASRRIGPGILLGSRITGLIPDWLLRVALSAILLYAAYAIFNR